MKTLILITLATLISCLSFSQDIIYKRDGSKIEAKVLEITETMIKYTKPDQPDGPIRNVAISEVRDIIYENGDWDKFDEKPIVKTEPPNEAERPIRKTEQVSKPDKDPIFGNGFFIEGMIGYCETTRYPASTYSYREDEMTVQMRLGMKWYLGSQEKKWRPGIQLTFLRLAIYHDLYQPQNYSLSPANIGFANIFKFSDNNGLELNANVGFNVINFDPPPFGNFDGEGGIIYGAEVKYRHKSFAVGLDYSRINSNITESYRMNRNLISLSIGRKF